MEVDIFRIMEFFKGKISRVVQRGPLIHGRKSSKMFSIFYNFK